MTTTTQTEGYLQEVAFHHTSESAFGRWDWLRFGIVTLLWTAANVVFWRWWLQQDATGNPWLYWPETLALFYQMTFLPSMLWHFLHKMRKPNEVSPVKGLRVALISPCVPSCESLGVIREQLEAMIQVTYPHDSWLLDEGGSPEVHALAEEYGVKYFTRHGIAKYNQPIPPFQAKTKAGNVNAWLDHVKDFGYEIFVQLDVDHRPRPDYLDRTLGYFRDPEIAWVQAPSVYGNLDNWTTRGLSEQDMAFQGALQAGFYGATGTPFIVGSHTTYRTAAIQEIGGFQPTRAEDHLDTIMLAARKYTGVFIPDRIAVGQGPNDFPTYLRQQFAWAYSMTQILFHHTPRLVKNYTIAQTLQFLFCQTWYPFWAVTMAALWILPSVSLMTREPIAAISLAQFAVYFAPVVGATVLIWFASRRWFQPFGLHLSWRGWVLQIARWPVALWALVTVMLRITFSYMITPKGKAAATAAPRAITLYGPYVVLAAVPLITMWLFNLPTGDSRGYCIIALFNAFAGFTVFATALGIDIRRLMTQNISSAIVVKTRADAVVMLVGLTAFLVASLAYFVPQL